MVDKERSRFDNEQREKRWRLNDMIKSIDLFGRNVPAFNIDGHPKANTTFGGTATFIFFLIIGSYAAFKFVLLVERQIPQVGFNYVKNYYGGNDKLNFNEANFRFAFTFVGK